KLKLLILVGIISVVGWLIYSYILLPAFYIGRVIYQKEFMKCPEGYVKFEGILSAYCATNSQKPCSAHSDCPENERCISKDGKNWFCTGNRYGCYHWNPENPEDAYCTD
ncbi:unnamed protein product, partial [marine sediment metagenome]